MSTIKGGYLRDRSYNHAHLTRIYKDQIGCMKALFKMKSAFEMQVSNNTISKPKP